MAPPSPILAIPNVTAHPSTASVKFTVFLYDGPLLCGFNVATKRLVVELQTLCHNNECRTYR